MNHRILYTALGLNEPSGGIRVLYRHVELLRSSGYNALIWDPKEHTPINWFETSVPVVHSDTIELDETDIIVIPEVLIYDNFDPAPGCRKIIYNQGHFLTFRTVPMDRYPKWDPVPAMWVSSLASYDVMQRLIHGLPVESVHLIPHGIDTQVFRPAGKREKKIVWMPQKRPDEAQVLHALFTTDSRFDGAALNAICGSTQQATATELGSASVFLALGHREGFGMPIAEALASGCAVVGYPAGGGAELFEAPGTHPIQESDAIAIVEKTAEILKSPPSEHERHSYRQWIVKNYPMSQQRISLIRAIENERAKPSCAGTAIHPYLPVKHFRK